MTMNLMRTTRAAAVTALALSLVLVPAAVLNAYAADLRPVEETAEVGVLHLEVAGALGRVRVAAGRREEQGDDDEGVAQSSLRGWRADLTGGPSRRKSMRRQEPKMKTPGASLRPASSSAQRRN